MNSGKLQAKQDTLKSLHCPSTQSSLFSSQCSALSSRLSSPSSLSLAPNPDQSARSLSSNPQYSNKSATRNPQRLFIDVSTELLRQGQSVRFRAPGHSMHPTIKEGETITVVPISSFDIKRGDILLYLVGKKVVAHRVVSIERKKSDVMTQSSKLSSHHLFLLRGDASGTCDEPVEAQQVLGKVVSVKRGGCSIDVYSRRAKMLRFVHAWLFRLKRWMIQNFLQVRRFFY